MVGSYVYLWLCVSFDALYSVAWQNILATSTRKRFLLLKYGAYASAQMVDIWLLEMDLARTSTSVSLYPCFHGALLMELSDMGGCQ
jgi:hypothetical protein